MFTAKTIALLNSILQILMLSMYVAIPFIILIIIMYIYQKYVKFREKETKEIERIIVKMNEEIVKDSKTIQELKDLKKELSIDVYDLQKKAAIMKQEMGIVESTVPDEETPKIDYSRLSIVELRKLAKDKNIKGFSRMKKEALVAILETS